MLAAPACFREPGRTCEKNCPTKSCPASHCPASHFSVARVGWNRRGSHHERAVQNCDRRGRVFRRAVVAFGAAANVGGAASREAGAEVRGCSRLESTFTSAPVVGK